MNSLSRIFSKKYTGCGKHLDLFYTHAKDIPFYNWAQLHDYDKENISLLLKGQAPKTILYHLITLFTGKQPKPKVCKSCAHDAYAKIHRSLIDVYGYPQDYTKTIFAKAEIELKEIEYILTGDTFIKTELALLRIEYAPLLLEKTNNDGAKFWDLIHDLSSILKMPLDAHKETLINIYDRRNLVTKTQSKTQGAGLYA